MGAKPARRMKEKGSSVLSVDLAHFSGSRAAVISERPTGGREELQIATAVENRQVSGMPTGISRRTDQPILRRRFSKKIRQDLTTLAG